jgi:hypothetical protein
MAVLLRDISHAAMAASTPQTKAVGKTAIQRSVLISSNQNLQQSKQLQRHDSIGFYWQHEMIR